MRAEAPVSRLRGEASPEDAISATVKQVLRAGGTGEALFAALRGSSFLITRHLGAEHVKAVLDALRQSGGQGYMPPYKPARREAPNR